MLEELGKEARMGEAREGRQYGKKRQVILKKARKEGVRQEANLPGGGKKEEEDAGKEGGM
ncbi:hypothetical protein E2C01_048383 [Portunus trituberculatus]|uniref:Uncharacterized protein n=1 Tax=Portunus trituberculatus TaxID=210409 RepID=A0A5B7GAE8_PORTR|nr:hypothetical protein [Portunus trituberculatus]